ncbi:hypothetical protein SAMN05444008_109189 [Cnuella takakiae]|uniref:Uncharacterized protein n=1 Tax=Cnuella takakiae TaxID=1302690 RepID=A0A1M5CRY8_9BACT|nr:hypothetical protein [Cnuella takakiae]SHF57456.1 hypothetical protein SAMN05444008_109189 [Cnuella takakiae]
MPNPKDIKDLLARKITMYVLVCTGVLGTLGIALVLVVLFRKGDTAAETDQMVDNGLKVLQFVFASILPLLGTWLGTILAFYFSKENFTAANESVRSLVDKITSDKKLASIAVKDAMIPLTRIEAYTVRYDSPDLAATILVKDMLQFLQHINRNRLVLLTSKDQARMVIHKSIITEFAAMNAANFETCTLKDMQEQGSERIRKILANSIAFVSLSATLQEAKKRMDERNAGGKEEICQDVFVTASGGSDEPVLGWITEVEIAKNSVVE